MSDSDSFKKFVMERVRFPDSETIWIVGQKVSLKDICKSFKRWALLNRELYQEPKKMTTDQIRKLCDDRFGKGQDDLYRGILLFMDEDEIEEFDQKKKEMEPPVPAKEVAERILASENRLELVTGMIEDKRAWSSEIDDLEALVASLKHCIAQKTEYTEKLLNKIALLYVSLPT